MKPPQQDLIIYGTEFKVQWIVYRLWQRLLAFHQYPFFLSITEPLSLSRDRGCPTIDHISQSPLQLGVSMWLSSGQWDVRVSVIPLRGRCTASRAPFSLPIVWKMVRSGSDHLGPKLGPTSPGLCTSGQTSERKPTFCLVQVTIFGGYLLQQLTPFLN